MKELNSFSGKCSLSSLRGQAPIMIRRQQLAIWIFTQPNWCFGFRGIEGRSLCIQYKGICIGIYIYMDFTPETSSQCVCAIYCNPSGYDVRLSAEDMISDYQPKSTSVDAISWSAASAPPATTNIYKSFSYLLFIIRNLTSPPTPGVGPSTSTKSVLIFFIIFRSCTLPELLALCKQHKHGRDGPSEDSAVALIWRRCPDTISYWQKLSWSIQHIVGQYLDHCLVNILDIVPG